MSTILKTALIQTTVIWEDPIQNLKNLSEKIDTIDPDVDLIILPELFATGFTMNVKAVAEKMDGKTVEWMRKIAENKQNLVVGSVIIYDDEKYYNRLIVAFPNQSIKFYDKRHLFSYAKENEVFAEGNKKLIFEYKGFRINPLICYDLRFPVWARNTEDIDLQIYVANWPNVRMYPWDTLLKARAIENLCYVIGVNRVGIDNNNLEYTGHSAVCNALGENVLHFDEGIEEIKIILLKKDHIVKTRKKYSFLDDRDDFMIKDV